MQLVRDFVEEWRYCLWSQPLVEVGCVMPFRKDTPPYRAKFLRKSCGRFILSTTYSDECFWLVLGRYNTPLKVTLTRRDSLVSLAECHSKDMMFLVRDPVPKQNDFPSTTSRPTRESQHRNLTRTGQTSLQWRPNMFRTKPQSRTASFRNHTRSPSFQLGTTATLPLFLLGANTPGDRYDNVKTKDILDNGQCSDNGESWEVLTDTPSS
jgi:hypothetical protein